MKYDVIKVSLTDQQSVVISILAVGGIRNGNFRGGGGNYRRG